MTERAGRRADASSRTSSARVRIETSAGGVVFRRTQNGVRFLLIRDPYHNWGLPKGHVEPEESPRDAAVREVAEETGLEEVDVSAELPCIDWYFRDRGRLIHKYCHFYLMEAPTGSAKPRQEEGISACVWLTYAEAMERISYENARAVLAEAGRRLGLDAETAPKS